MASLKGTVANLLDFFANDISYNQGAIYFLVLLRFLVNSLYIFDIDGIIKYAPDSASLPITDG